jgi:hypothetical protein
MKKLLLSASMLLTAGFAFAQVGNGNAPVKEKNVDLRVKTVSVVVNPSNVNTNSSTRAKKAVVQDWYQPLNFITQFQGGESPLGAVLDRSISFVTADSNFKVVREDGAVSRPSFQSFGHVLDPKDDLIENTENPGIILSQFNPYTLDSIFFQYVYLRNADSTDNDVDGNNEEVIDTVFVAYFANANIRRTNFTGGAQDKVSLLRWNNAALMPADLVKIDTFLLGNDRSNSPFDTTSASSNETLFGSKFAQLTAPSGLNVNAGGLVGFTATFKSGVKAVVNGDTAVIVYQRDPSVNPNTSRRANTFGTLYYYNDAANGVPFTNPTYYNSCQFQPQWNAYGQNASWTGNYLVGHAFAADLFLNTAFHLTSLNVGVAENDLVAISSVYPNPANGSTTVSFNLKQAGNVAVNITNLLGQTVATINSGKLAAGSNNVSLNLSNIKAGVYFVNVSVDGVSTTKKLTVTE